MRRYYIETEDGEWKLFKENRINRWLGVVPRIDGGTITLENKIYVIDPHKFRRMKIRKFPFRKQWVQIQLWKENAPDPIDYFASKGREDDMAGDTLAMLSRSKRLQRLIQPDTNWFAVIAVLAIFAVIALSAVVYEISRK